jgi:hypothetical protein
MYWSASKFVRGRFARSAADARRLTKHRLKADLRIHDVIRFDGGYGQQRRTREWAAFAFAECPKPSNKALKTKGKL